MLTKEQVIQFDETGFLKGAVVLNDAEVELLRNELDDVMAGRKASKPVLNHNMPSGSMGYGMTMSNKETVVQIVNIWMVSEVFLKHAENSKICEEVAQLCRTHTLRIWHDQIQYKPPITGGLIDWHQDHPAWPMIQPADLISAWVALDDATIDSGCMWMVPGSHKWGNNRADIGVDERFMPYHKRPKLLPKGAVISAVPFEMKKGQVGYHHCMTWHGSSYNRSAHKRRAITVHYMPGHIWFEPTGHHVMEQFIKVGEGEIVDGDEFPIVYRKT